jgi:hypothetical protein
VTPDGVCPGPCNNRWRRAEKEYKAALAAWDKAMSERKPGDPEPGKPEPHQVVPWHGRPVFCGRCSAQIRAELAELDEAACIVAAAADGHRGAGTEPKVTGTHTEPSVSPAADDADELASALRGWVSALRGTDPRHRKDWLASEITVSAAWLLSHFDAMITHQGFGADFGLEMHWWHRRLLETGKSGIVWHKKPMPCSRCHHMSLRQEDGAKYVECSRKSECGRLMSINEYEAEYAEWSKDRGEKIARLRQAS